MSGARSGRTGILCEVYAKLLGMRVQHRLLLVSCCANIWSEGRSMAVAAGVVRVVRLRQTGFSGLHNGLGTVGHLQLTEDVGDVVAHGFRAEAQLMGNGVIVRTLRHEPEHVALAL